MPVKRKPAACSLKSSRPRWQFLGICLLAISIAITGCTTAFIGIGVVVVGVGAAAIAYECDEPVSVSVWDPMKAHAVCDAEVTATSGDTHVDFSPCYVTALGEGTWTVTAFKQGYSPATGTVIVSHDHSCSQPVRHSLELSLNGPGPPMPPPPPGWMQIPGPPPTGQAPAPVPVPPTTPAPTATAVPAPVPSSSM
jgi:hypothetical protein